MKLINDNLLDTVSEQAKNNERLRMNYNFHESMDDKIHRLLNAMEPGTQLPPHRHLNPDKEEIYLVLRGSLVAFSFDENGKVISSDVLSPSKGKYGVAIPAGVWHSIVVLEPGTVIYEIKEGPYAPIDPSNIAPWAPDASDKESIEEFTKKLLADAQIEL